MASLEQFIASFPPITRTYMAAALLTTAACALDVLSPFSLYFSWVMVYEKGQVRRAATRRRHTSTQHDDQINSALCSIRWGTVPQSLTGYSSVCSVLPVATTIHCLLFQFWRLFTNFFFFGAKFSLEFLFHMFFLVQYCRSLEEGSFRGRTADFFYMILFGATLLLFIAPFAQMVFLGSSLTFMMVYIWARRNPFGTMNSGALRSARRVFEPETGGCEARPAPSRLPVNFAYFCRSFTFCICLSALCAPSALSILSSHEFPWAVHLHCPLSAVGAAGLQLPARQRR
jgi:hypothetical protein